MIVGNNKSDKNLDHAAKHPATKTKVSTINDAIVINAKTAKNDTIGNMTFNLLIYRLRLLIILSQKAKKRYILIFLIFSGKKVSATDTAKDKNGDMVPKSVTKECRISSNVFMLYYWILMFLLCFATPVLVTSSLNVFIYSAVKNTTYEVNESYIIS